MKSIKFIYFDIGNVIYAFESGIEDLAKLLGLDYETCWSYWFELDVGVCRGVIPPQELWLELKARSNYQGNDIDFMDFWVRHFSPINETHILINNLVDKYHLGLLSNIYPAAFELATTNGALPKVSWNAKVFSCDLGFIKPETEIYEIAETLAERDPQNILFIDDTNVNLIKAQTRGWQTYLFDKLDPHKSTQELWKILNVQNV